MSATPAAVSGTSGRKYPQWRRGKWASTLPESYFAEMQRLVDEMHRGVFSERDIAEGYADYVTVRNVFGRMEIAQMQIIPWITRAIPDLARKSILEIGCGTGSATAPLAMASGHVHAFDLSAEAVKLAHERCRLLGLENVTVFDRDTSWTGKYAANPRAVCDARIDVIVCYALFEHLMPLERIDLLIGAWKHLAVGGRLIVVESPNRLYPFDWHSSQLAFMDQLPDEIAYLWNGFSPRASVPADIRAMSRDEASKGNRERLFRFGRGASFHEFHAVLGPQAYRVVSSMDRVTMAGHNHDYVAMLQRQLADIDPPVHPGFAFPSLDLVMEKTGPARLT